MARAVTAPTSTVAVRVTARPPRARPSAGRRASTAATASPRPRTAMSEWPEGSDVEVSTVTRVATGGGGGAPPPTAGPPTPRGPPGPDGPPEQRRRLRDARPRRRPVADQPRQDGAV